MGEMMTQLSFLPEITDTDLEQTIENLNGLHHEDRQELFRMIRKAVVFPQEELFIYQTNTPGYYFIHENDLKTWWINFAIKDNTVCEARIWSRRKLKRTKLIMPGRMVDIDDTISRKRHRF